MNIKKRIIIVLAITTFFIPFFKTKAIVNFEENTHGNSNEFIEGILCEELPDGTVPDYCYSWSEDFVVEIALVDKNMNIVYNSDGKSTQSVQFRPYNPYAPWGYGKEERWINTENYNDWNPKLEHDIYNPIMYTVNYSHAVNNMNSGANRDQISKYKYWVYMGFGYCNGDNDAECEAAAVKNNFSDYEQNRAKFIKYITSLERKQRVIDEETGFDGNVSFLDFFLKVSGYTDVWNFTENPDNMDTIDGYYLAIEPVYSVSAWKNGIHHSYTGTAKYIGNFLYHNPQIWNNNNWYANWFGIFNVFNEPKYNLLCNFYDKSGFNNQVVRTGITKPQNYVENNQWMCTNPYNARYISTRDMSNLLGWVQSSFGVNIVKIGEGTYNKNLLRAYSCDININSCQDDSYKLELNLTPKGDNETGIFNCVYPSKVDSKELDKYFYHVGEGNKELWCYDDIIYDFSNLKESLSGKTVFGGKLREMPNGKLTVKRTCFSKEEATSESLNSAFVADSGTYQDKFDFKFGNDTYQYKRINNKYYDAGKSAYDTYPPQKGSRSGSKNQDFYKYTSTFYYDYEINNSYDSKSKIGINNQQISNTLLNSSSIQFESQYDNKSRIIMVKNQPTNLQTFDNTLSMSINNGYGLSNKLYNELKNKAKPSTSDRTDTNVNKSNARIQKGNNEVNLFFDETSKQTCDVQSKIENTIIDNLRFRVISLDNPFPGRDGTLRMPSANWVNITENNVYDYIQNNRNVKTEEVYNKEPLYKITLDGTAMMKIREYNKTHSYGSHDITCENDTGRKCISNFLKDKNYIKNMTGTCANINSKNTTNYYSCADKTEKSGG